MKETFNAALVKMLADKYRISPRYVRYCLKGERSPTYAESIKRDYRKFMNQIEFVIKKELELIDR